MLLRQVSSRGGFSRRRGPSRAGAGRRGPAAWVVSQAAGKRARGDGPADVRHQPLVEPNIMHGSEDRAKHLAGEKKVPNRPAGKRPAGVAVAPRLDRPVVPDVLAVPQPD